MSRYLGGRYRRNQQHDNPYWSNIQKAKDNLDKLTPRAQVFIQDMHSKGPGHIMTEKQIRWLGGIMNSVYK